MSYEDSIRMIQNSIAHRHSLYSQCKNTAEDSANEQAIDILRAAKKLAQAEENMKYAISRIW